MRPFCQFFVLRERPARLRAVAVLKDRLLIMTSGLCCKITFFCSEFVEHAGFAELDDRNVVESCV